MVVAKVDSIRQIIRQKRDQITTDQRYLLAKQASRHLLASCYYKNSQHIGCYMAFSSELDTRLVIEQIWRDGKTCYLPVIDSDNSTMSFYCYNANDKLQANEFGILEPAQTSLLNAEKLQLVIMPLIAFNDQGDRLGSGCGYYDRVFANQDTWQAKPLLCGFAYQLQFYPDLKPEPWDVPMDIVVTNENLIMCR